MNLPAIATAAAKTAFGLAASVLGTWRVKYGGTTAHNPATGKSAPTWTHDEPVQALRYKPKDKRTTPEDADAKTRALAFLAADLTAPDALTESGQVTDPAGTVWQITDVDRDPAGAIIILTLRL